MSLAQSSGKFPDYEGIGDFGEVPLGSIKIPSTIGEKVGEQGVILLR